ncbi:unnamed protein product [Linum tenue]|uniref:Uncharacterized protein n=1 Tax=Linum tenue TaxID=586396 RepID=A0AAV0NQY7_9ROSI|nr:unnamed protein product [Linum tenue]
MTIWEFIISNSIPLTCGNSPQFHGRRSSGAIWPRPAVLAMLLLKLITREWVIKGWVTLLFG